MTPEQMGAALGAGWEPILRGWRWVPSVARPAVFVQDTAPAGAGRAEWVVTHYAGGARRVYLPCTSAEVAVAVAGLLVAAERIAAGAEVGRPPLLTVDAYDGGLVQHGTRNYTAASARRLALDLLRAADEAEAQP